SNASFQDLPPAEPFHTMIQIAQRLGLAIPSSMGPCLSGSNPSGTNPPIVPPPGFGVVSNPLVCPYFGPDVTITRAEAAYWIVRSQANETEISNFLCATGGDPSGLSPGCPGFAASTFADLGVGGGSIVNPFVGVSNIQFVRYIEVMARRGYTKGCNGTDDPTRRFCPNDRLNRAQIAIFTIRAMMDNAFPTSLSGIVGAFPYGYNFGFPPIPYFTDVTPADPVWGIYFPYVQKMRELGITHGTSPTTYSPGL